MISILASLFWNTLYIKGLLFNDLLSRSRLQYCSRQLVWSELRTTAQRAKDRLTAVAETVTVERAQLIGQVNMARHENCDTDVVDGRARLYSL